jgi:hypothetical protein
MSGCCCRVWLPKIAVLPWRQVTTAVLAHKHYACSDICSALVPSTPAPCGVGGLLHAFVANNNPHMSMHAVLLLCCPMAECTSNPPDIPNRSWDCSSTAIGESCTAKCSPGFDYAPPPTAVCTAVAWSPYNNTATAWSPVNGTCQPSPTVPNSDLAIQTSRLPLRLAFTGSCNKQAADALGNSLVNDLQQLLSNAQVNDTAIAVLKASCSSANKRSSVSDHQQQQHSCSSSSSAGLDASVLCSMMRDVLCSPMH